MDRKVSIVLREHWKVNLKISNANFRYIFLSYNNEGLMNVDAIKNILSRYGTYRCFTQSYRRFKADKDKNRNISGKETTEYLHCLIKEE